MLHNLILISSTRAQTLVPLSCQDRYMVAIRAPAPGTRLLATYAGRAPYRGHLTVMLSGSKLLISSTEQVC